MEITVEETPENAGDDIKSALMISTTPPEEAAQNIDRSRLFEVTPDAYKNLKSELDPEALGIERTPSTIEPEVEKTLRQSEQHASLFKEDIDKMNFFEKRAKYYKLQTIDIPEKTREINNLLHKVFDGQELDEGEKEFWQDLNAEKRQMEEYGAAFEIEGPEQLAVDVASATGDFIRGYYDNKELAATLVGGGAALGFAGGLAVPIPGAAIVGLKAGAIKGAIGASTLVGFVDGYKQMSRSLFNELSFATDDQGQPLNIPHNKMVNVAQGVGLFAGVAGGLSGKVLASNNPFLKQFLSPKLAAKYVTSPAMLARMDILGGIAKTAMAEGAEESFQELVQIFGSEFAKIDGSEASFENALDATIESAGKTFTAENLGKAGYSGTVGVLTGGLIQTVTSAPGYKGLSDRYAKVQQVTQRKQEVLSTQNNMLELANDLKEMKAAELSPIEMSNFKKKVLSSVGIDENVWFNLEDLREFSNSPEKGAAIRKIIDPTGELTKLSQELNTPLQVSKADMLEVVTEFPELTDYMRLTPDGQNPLEVRNEAKDFADRLGEAETRRNTVLETLGVDETMTLEQEAELNASLEPVKGSKYFESREDYLGQTGIQPINGILNEKEANEWNQAQLKARLEIDKNTVAVVDKRFDRYEDAEFRTETEQDIEVEVKNLEKEYSIIESFQKPITDSQTGKGILEHKKKGFSSFAIDPRSLNEAQKIMYFDNNDILPSYKRNMKERKVFVEGGITVDEAAVLNGLDSGEQLLKLLAETPTKKQIEQRIKNDPIRNQKNRNEIRESMEATKAVARDESIANLTRVHLKEMEYMVKNSWTTVKRGIIKIAKKVPSIESLNRRSKDTVSTMKIRDLNAKRFEMGERKTQQTAMKNIVDGEIEQAFANKEKAALNNEMRRETLKAEDKVDRYLKFWKRVETSPTIQQELKDAGMSDTMDEFRSLYKLDGNLRGETEQKSFNNFIKKQAEAGNFVPEIPDRLDNTQTSYKDLTVEQYQAITEMGQFIVHQAKLKNKLMQSIEARNELRTAETIAEDIEKHTTEHMNFDPKKAEKKNAGTLSVTEKWKNGVQTSLSAIASIKTVISELDGYQLNGYFHNLIGKPIKEARSSKRREIQEIETHDKKLIQEFYGDKFAENYNFIEVSEFSNIPSIGDGEGNIRKADLLVLQAYMGDPDGRAAVTNFVDRDGNKIDIETVQKVLDRELTSKDAAFVQNFMVDRFKRFEKRSAELHKKTTGIEPDMVKGETVIHNNKVLPGGYYPIKRQILPDEVRASNFLADLKDKATDLGLQDEGHFFARMRSAEMTQQGRLKDRTGSQRPLDLSFENVFDFTEEAIHDLNFREVGIDTLKVLKNPLNVKNMKAVVGPKKFVALLNGVKDMVSKTTERESTLFGEEHQMINNIIQKAHSLHAVKAIGLNLTSAAIQADSLTNLMLRVGPKIGVYLAKTAAKMSTNILHYGKYVALAQEINPDIKFEQDGIDNAIIKHSYDFLPASTSFFKNHKNSSGQAISRIRGLQKKAIDASFYLVRESDKFNKVITTLAVSEQFLNGDVDGFPMSKLETMSDAEKAEVMRSIVQQASDLSLTASSTEDKTAIEKNKVASVFVRYWTDRRSRLNSVIAQIDKTKGAIKKGDNAKAAKHVLTLALAMGVSSAFVAAVRNEEESIFRKMGKIKDGGDAADFALDTAWSFAKAPIDQTLDTIPLIDGIKYQTEINIRSDYRSVSTPLFGVASDIASGVVIMKEVLDQALQGRTTKLSDTQRKFLLTNAGYLAGGAPTNGIYKILEALQGGAVRRGSKHLKEEILELHETMDKYIDAFGDDPEAKDFIEDLKEYKKELPQFDADVKNIIPENTKETLKVSLSNGEWSKFDKETGAAGIYQFTEERWNEISAINPDLALTENGRVSKNTEQQEKAMDWVLADTTRGLLTYEIPVTEPNILGAHKFGFDNFAAIFEGQDNEKLSDVIGEEAKNPVFKDFLTVKSVKNYLSRVTTKGK